MRAAVSFNVYFDYCQFFKEIEDGEIDEEYGYTGALEVLNQQVKKLINANKLTILYGGKRCKIRGNIKEYECGDIFDAFEPGGAHWNQVEIWCTLPGNPKKFDWDKLRVGVCPSWFEPIGKLFKN